LQSICLGSSCLPQNIHLGLMSHVNLVPPSSLRRPNFLLWLEHEVHLSNALFAILHGQWHLANLTHSQVTGWTHLRVHQSVVAESWDSEGAPDFQHYKGVERRARSLRIKLGRGTSRSSLNLHQDKPQSG
jgi:hypothetical protein